MKSTTFFLTVLLLVLHSMTNAQVRLNEVCSKNDGNLIVAGDTPDWIELYNEGDEAINLLGYQLSDDLDEPAKWTFPSVILDAGGYIVVLADDADTQDSYLHTNFKLSSGENIVFSDSEGEEIEELDVVTLDPDTTYARVEGKWRRATPTPGASNEGSGLPQLSTPDFSIETGVYPAGQSVTITTTAANGRIEYYLNDLQDLLKTDVPSLTIDLTTTTMVCARADAPDKEQSDQVCKTYIIGAHSLPIISIMADEHALFDQTDGLFSLGPDAEPDWPYLGANFWSDRSEEVYFQYFNNGQDDIFQGHADLEMHGGRQARTHPQKTFKLLAKGKYSQAYFNYPFFAAKPTITSFKRLVVRNASGDYNVGHCRDGFLQDHFARAELDLDGVSYQPVAVYINGSYYGLMGLREKVDEYYTESNYGTKHIDLLEEEKTVVEGDAAIFDDHFAFVRDTDLSDPAAYQQAATYFDISNLIDYFVVQIGFSNSDWPINNIKYWREKTADAQWRFFLFDMDAAMGRYSWTEADDNILADKLGISLESSVYITIMQSFLRNASFRNALLNRHQDLFNTALSTDDMLAAFADFEAKVDNEMSLHLMRWPTLTYQDWKGVELQKIKNYLTDRPLHSMEHFEDYFNLDGIYNLSLQSNVPEARFELNSLPDVMTGFEGAYFVNIPIRVKGKAIEGLEFVHWEINSNGNSIIVESEQLEQAFDQDTELVAVYRPVSTTDFVVSFSMSEAQLDFELNLSSTEPLSYTLVDIGGRVLINGTQPVKPSTTRLSIPYLNITPGVKILTLQQGDLHYVTKIAAIK